MNNYQTQQFWNDVNGVIGFTASIIVLGFMVGMVKPFTKDLLSGEQPQGSPGKVTTTQPKLVIEKKLQPSFKVRTIHYDDFNISFGPHGEQIERGELSRHPEYGTSMSLDGAYLDYPYFEPGISLLFPLKPSKDLPKFYLNPFGQYVVVGYMLDSPTFIRECEVKYPGILYTKDCIGAVIHIGHEKINKDLERARERWAEPSPETPVERQAEYARSLTLKSEWYAKTAHELLTYVEQHFHILPEVSITNFRLMAREVTPKVRDYHSPKLRDKEEWQTSFDNLVELSRPYHEAVAGAYNLSYSNIVSSAWEHIKSHLET